MTRLTFSPKSGNDGIFVQGHNHDVTTAETIWHPGGLFPWAAVGTNGLLSIVSTDAADTAAGTGARIIRILGMVSVTINGVTGLQLQKEEVVLNGLTPVASTKQFAFVRTAIVLSTGSGLANAGAINISLGGTVIGQIAAAENRATDAVIIIPHFTDMGTRIQGGTITDLWVTMIGSTNAYAYGAVWASVPNSNIFFRLLPSTISLDKDLFMSPTTSPYLEAGTRIEVRAQGVSVGSVEIFCGMHIVWDVGGA